MNASDQRTQIRRLRSKAAELKPGLNQARMAKRIAQRLADRDLEIKTAAEIFKSLHKLPEAEFETWIELGTTILEDLTGTTDRGAADDGTNEVIDEFATRWVIKAWAKISPSSPNAYQRDQAFAAAITAKEEGYMDVDAAIDDIEEVFEAADNITTDQYLRLGYKFIEHTVEPEDRIAWADCEQYAEDLIKQELEK